MDTITLPRDHFEALAFAMRAAVEIDAGDDTAHMHLDGQHYVTTLPAKAVTS